VKWVVVINFTVKCILLVKNTLFGSRDLSFLIFRILAIPEIDFWDFGHLGNQIRDIGFKILTFQILEFGILTSQIFVFRILALGGMEFRVLDCK